MRLDLNKTGAEGPGSTTLDRLAGASGAARSGVIDSVDGDCPLAERLLALGFCAGTPVRFVRRAPLGDPLVFALRGSEICLRRSEAARVRVRRPEAAA